MNRQTNSKDAQRHLLRQTVEETHFESKRRFDQGSEVGKKNKKNTNRRPKWFNASKEQVKTR